MSSKSKKVGRKGNSILVGDRFLSNSGDWCTVVKYEIYSKITITYDNSPDKQQVVGGNSLKKGTFLNEDSLLYKVGSRHKNKDGEFCTVVSCRNSKDISVVFDGYEGYIKKVYAGGLKSGSFKNNYRPSVCGIGYIGEGKHKSKNNGKVTDVYFSWRNMLARCYDEANLANQRTYRDCSVCEEFKNFQVFAEWYTTHESFGLGYEIDKDLLISGNKIYSPETCTFLPKEINVALNKERVNKGISLGLTKRENRDKYRALVFNNGIRIHLGDYDTPEEASEAYVKAKEEYVKYVAEKWKGKIEDRAYQALMNWTVYPKEGEE